MTPTDFDPDARPSKSQLKRDMLALQTLGARLVELTPSALASVPLSDDLRTAVQLCRRITAREGRRRQLQYIGRLMRDIDPEPVQRALDRIDAPGREDAALLHATERWRERLLGDPSALAEWRARLPGPADPAADAELVRLLAAAAAEHAQARHGRAYRELFRHLRAALERPAAAPHDEE